MNNPSPAYMNHVLQTCLATDQFGEAAKRLKYSPFDNNEFKWWLIHDNGPHFFVLRDLLRRGNHIFSVTAVDPNAMTSLDHSVVLTPWSAYQGDKSVRVRGSQLERTKMPLYVESGEWDCPQMNPLFDWTEDQAWAYLIHRDLIDISTPEMGYKP